MQQLERLDNNSIDSSPLKSITAVQSRFSGLLETVHQEILSQVSVLNSQCKDKPVILLETLNAALQSMEDQTQEASVSLKGNMKAVPDALKFYTFMRTVGQYLQRCQDMTEMNGYKVLTKTNIAEINNQFNSRVNCNDLREQLVITLTLEFNDCCANMERINSSSLSFHS